MAAVPIIHIAPLRDGHVSYVMRRFELPVYLANLERFKITDIFVVPPLVISIIMSPLSRKHSLKSVKQASCGAAPLDKEQQARFKDLLANDAQVTQVWGMTETTCITTMFRWPEDDASGSVGMLVPHMRAKCVHQLTTMDPKKLRMALI